MEKEENEGASGRCNVSPLVDDSYGTEAFFSPISRRQSSMIYSQSNMEEEKRGGRKKGRKKRKEKERDRKGEKRRGKGGKSVEWHDKYLSMQR